MIVMLILSLCTIHKISFMYVVYVSMKGQLNRKIVVNFQNEAMENKRNYILLRWT